MIVMSLEPSDLVVAALAACVAAALLAGTIIVGTLYGIEAVEAIGCVLVES